METEVMVPDEIITETEPIEDAAPLEEGGDSGETITDSADAPVDAGETINEAPAVPSGPPDNKRWYIVKVQSGREDTIREAIERKVRIEGLEDCFGQIIVPVEKVSELRNGKRVVRSRKMFPGYLMTNVEFNDRILYLFRETSGVGDFVGASQNRAPSPMSPREVEQMLRKHNPKGAVEQAVEKVKIPFDKGDRVRVRDGTFSGMEGEVKEIVEPKDAKESAKVRVELTIFGRPVPVEVEVWQVETL